MSKFINCCYRIIIFYIEVYINVSAVFDIIPDLCTVKVTDNTGFVLFEDIADNLPNLKVDTATDVQVELTAKWYEESGRDYYGESKYVFNATLTAPATFYVLENEMDPGEFIALSRPGGGQAGGPACALYAPVRQGTQHPL